MEAGLFFATDMFIQKIVPNMFSIIYEGAYSVLLHSVLYLQLMFI